MVKTGKPRKTGGPSSPAPAETQFENPPRLPPAPIHVAEPKLPKLPLAARSPLSVAFSHIRPSWRSYIQYVDLAARRGDSAMARFRDCYAGLSKRDQNGAWPEQLCDMANVTPGELVGAVCRQIWESKAAESSMVSSIAHPELLLDTIRFARREENYRDRELYFRMMGSLPDRKGASINIFNAAAGQVGAADLPDLGVGRPKPKLKSFDEEVIEMSRDLEGGDGKTLSQIFREEERRRPSPDRDPPFLVKDEDVSS